VEKIGRYVLTVKAEYLLVVTLFNVITGDQNMIEGDMESFTRLAIDFFCA
jgi:hypothetical protein